MITKLLTREDRKAARYIDEEDIADERDREAEEANKKNDKVLKGVKPDFFYEREKKLQ